MKLIYVTGEYDYGALMFDQSIDNKEFTLEEVASDMKAGDSKSVLVRNGEDCVDVKMYEFGDVDPKFIEFIRNTVQDYDDSKHQNFYIIEDANK